MEYPDEDLLLVPLPLSRLESIVKVQGQTQSRKAEDQTKTRGSVFICGNGKPKIR